MATHSSVLAWRIPGTGEPGGLPSLGSHRVGHDCFLDLIYEIIKSTIDVVFNKIMRRNIDPVVIDVETVLERPVSQTILANSISLTPGTLSVDLDSENQIIKVAAISPRSKEDIIPFEPYIKKMLE